MQHKITIYSFLHAFESVCLQVCTAFGNMCALASTGVTHQLHSQFLGLHSEWPLYVGQNCIKVSLHELIGQNCVEANVVVEVQQLVVVLFLSVSKVINLCWRPIKFSTKCNQKIPVVKWSASNVPQPL